MSANWYHKMRKQRLRDKARERELREKLQKCGRVTMYDEIERTVYSWNRRFATVAKMRSQ